MEISASNWGRSWKGDLSPLPGWTMICRDSGGAQGLGRAMVRCLVGPAASPGRQVRRGRDFLKLLPPFIGMVFSFCCEAQALADPGARGICFPSARLYEAGPGPYSVAAGDLDGDGALDLVIANCDSNVVTILWYTGQGEFAPPSHLAVRGGTTSVFCADLDADGDSDIVASNDWDSTLTVLTNEGGRTFSTSNYADGRGAYFVLAVDLDGDGYPEIAATSCWGWTLSVLRNYGNGTFSAPTSYNLNDRPNSICAADFDHDGHMDLVVASAWSIHVFKGNGNGTLAMVMSISRLQIMRQASSRS